MTETITIPYVPHPGQRRFHELHSKFRAIITGIGFGKSAAGANELLRFALEYPRATHLIIAPTSKMLKNASLPQFLKFCPPELIKVYLKSQGILILTNGAKILLLSADNQRHIERLRGIEIGSFWADEGALLLLEVWKILLGRLRDPHGPRKGIVTTTPKGMFHWLYFYFVKKTDPETRQPLENPSDYEWVGGTTLDNPYTPEDWKQNIVVSYHGKFKKQEIYGEFTSFEGQVYDNFQYDQHVLRGCRVDIVKGHVFLITPTKAIELREFPHAIDWGFTNPQVCLWGGMDADGRLYIIREYYRTQQAIEHLADWMRARKAECLVTGRGKGYADPAEPSLIHKMGQLGHYLVPANNEILPGIQDVYETLALRPDGSAGVYFLEECTNTIEEIGKYRYDTPKGEAKNTKEKPLDKDNHACDALRYLIRSHIKKPRGRIGFLKDPENIMGLQ